MVAQLLLGDEIWGIEKYVISLIERLPMVGVDAIAWLARFDCQSSNLSNLPPVGVEAVAVYRKIVKTSNLKRQSEMLS